MNYINKEGENNMNLQTKKEIILTNMNCYVDKIALAYDFQVLEIVPMAERDVRINGIITNKEVILI